MIHTWWVTTLCGRCILDTTPYSRSFYDRTKTDTWGGVTVDPRQGEYNRRSSPQQCNHHVGTTVALVTFFIGRVQSALLDRAKDATFLFSKAGITGVLQCRLSAKANVSTAAAKDLETPIRRLHTGKRQPYSHVPTVVVTGRDSKSCQMSVPCLGQLLARITIKTRMHYLFGSSLFSCTRAWIQDSSHSSLAVLRGLSGQFEDRFTCQ